METDMYRLKDDRSESEKTSSTVEAKTTRDHHHHHNGNKNIFQFSI